MTIQVPDTLTTGERRYLMTTTPLAVYFDEHPTLQPDLEAPDSSLWRGYVAEWTIDGDRLYLVGLVGWPRGRSVDDPAVEVPLGPVFPDAGADTGGDDTADGRVWARWFTGDLRARPRPSGDASSIEDAGETVWHIDAGVVVRSQDLP